MSLTTNLNGRTALRACCVNHRTTPAHVERLLAVLHELGARVHRSLQLAPA